MIHVGRHSSDDRAPRLVWRGVERWEQIARGEAAERVVLWVLERRRLGTLGLELDVEDVREAQRWIDRVAACGLVGVTPSGIGSLAPLTPYDVFSGDATFQSWHRADLGVTVGTGIAEWRGAKGAHPTWTASQSTGSLQPAWTASEPTLFGRPCGSGDGSDDYLLLGWNPPAIATQNLYLRAIARQNTWVGGRAAFAGSSVSLVYLRGTGSTPLVGMRTSSATGSIAMAVGTWFRTETFAGGGSGTDWMRIGSNQTSGLTSGTVDASAFAFFGAASGANGAFSIAEVTTCTAEPSALKRALSDGIEAAWYGGAVTAG